MIERTTTVLGFDNFIDIVIGVTDPDMALTLSNAYLEKNYMYKFAASWLGEGLITATVPTWKQHRRLLCSSFNPVVLEGFIDIFNTQSSKLVARLTKEAGKGQFDHWPYFSEHALETICQTAFGIPTNDESVADKEYADAVAQMLGACMTRSSQVWMHLDCLYRWSSTKRKEDEAVKILKRVSDNIIQKRKQTWKEEKESGQLSGRKFKAFLDLMLELAEGGKLTDQEIREEVDTLIVAGHDTTSHTLLFLFILLGSYPEVQQRVFEELKSVFDESEDYVTKEHLSQLVYTEAVIKETCRLYPVIPIVARHADKDVRFDKFTIPAGTGVIICLYGIGRSRCWGSDAEAFRPERWLEPASVPAAPAAFSLGRRGCMGKTQAMMSMKTTIAHVVKKFKITANVKQMKLKFDFMIKPVSGHHITLELR